MRSRTFRLRRPVLGKSYTKVFLSVFFAYIVLFAAGFNALTRNTEYEHGQFGSQDTYSGENLQRSLDLTLAAKSNFPSGPLKDVRTVSISGGLTEKVISFDVVADGLKEYGLLVAPSAKPPKDGWPAIILCHGYANPGRYSTLESYLPDMEFYARHGFLVVKPDFRGQGLSIDSGQPDSAYYSMAYNTDVMSLISALKKTNYINKTDINLWGHSLGAYIALRAAVLSPDIRNLILLSGPVDSLSKMFLTYIPPSDENNLNALRTRSQIFDKYGIPSDQSQFWHNASPINFVSKIKAHIQIHVGSLDQVVPPEFSADLDAALNQQHIQHEYYVYPDGAHALLPQLPVVYARSLSVLENHKTPSLPQT